MDKTKLIVSDEDFNDTLSFKATTPTVDYKAFLLLDAYLRGRNDIVEMATSVNNIDSEFQGYREFSEGLFDRLDSLLSRFMSPSLRKEQRFSCIKPIIVLSAQINSYCKGGKIAVSCLKELEKIKEKELDESSILKWGKVIQALYASFCVALENENKYIAFYKEKSEKEKQKINSSLPEEIHGAKPYLVEQIKEKESYIAETFDKVSLLNAYYNVRSAIEGYGSPSPSKKAIIAAYQKFMEHCRYVDKCEIAPHVYSVSELFNFYTYESMVDSFKNDEVLTTNDIRGIDINATKKKDAYLTQMKKDCSGYIFSAIKLAQNTGLLPEDFNINEMYSKEKEKNKVTHKM